MLCSWVGQAKRDAQLVCYVDTQAALQPQGLAAEGAPGLQAAPAAIWAGPPPSWPCTFPQGTRLLCPCPQCLTDRSPLRGGPDYGGGALQLSRASGRTTQGAERAQRQALPAPEHEPASRQPFPAVGPFCSLKQLSFWNGVHHVQPASLPTLLPASCRCAAGVSERQRRGVRPDKAAAAGHRPICSAGGLVEDTHCGDGQEHRAESGAPTGGHLWVGGHGGGPRTPFDRIRRSHPSPMKQGIVFRDFMLKVC